MCENSEFLITSCCDCGVKFWMPANMLKQRMDNGGNFYCPNGHVLHFGETPLGKAQKENQKLLDRLAETQYSLDIAIKQADAAESKLQKLTKKSKKAV